MKIAFVLPAPPSVPIGGYRIVYQYANALCKKGHEISIYYNANRGKNLRHIPTIIFYILTLIIKRNRWFQLNDDIKEKIIYDIEGKYLEEQDAIFATSYVTSKKVEELSIKFGKKYYLIQDFEDWGREPEEVYASYNYKFTNIAVSKYLYNLVIMHSIRRTLYIPNGLSCEEWGIDTPIENRDKHSLCFLYHTSRFKGTEATLEVVERLKKEYPDLTVKCFGASKKPEKLPSFIEYYENVNRKHLRELYNSCAIFICSTIKEGFGLTGAESMACGCAFVSTKYEAVLDYAIDGENALLSSIGDIDQMVKNAERLLNDSDYRTKIAQKGSLIIEKRNINLSAERLEHILVEDNIQI